MEEKLAEIIIHMACAYEELICAHKKVNLLDLTIQPFGDELKGKIRNNFSETISKFEPTYELLKGLAAGTSPRDLFLFKERKN